MPLLAIADGIASRHMHEVVLVNHPVINDAGVLQIFQRKPKLAAKVWLSGILRGAKLLYYQLLMSTD